MALDTSGGPLNVGATGEFARGIAMSSGAFVVLWLRHCITVQRPSPCPSETLALEAKVKHLEAMVCKLSRDVVRLVSGRRSSTATVPSRLPDCGVPVGPVAHASSVDGSCPSVLLPFLTCPEPHDEESVRFLLMRTLLERERERDVLAGTCCARCVFWPGSDSHVCGVSLSSFLGFR